MVFEVIVLKCAVGRVVRGRQHRVEAVGGQFALLLAGVERLRSEARFREYVPQDHASREREH